MIMNNEAMPPLLSNSPVRRHVHGTAELIAGFARSHWGFAVVLGLVVSWAVGWVLLDFSKMWHTLFDVLATITMLLLIFGLEVSQNRANRATQLKLDELLRVSTSARTELVKMEERSEEELDALQAEFQDVQQQHATVAAEGGRSDQATEARSG